MASTRVVYDSEHLQVIYQPALSTICVVTFNGMRLKANGRDFWASDFLAKAGVCAIGFVSKRPNWFPAAEVRRAVKAIAAQAPTAGHRLVTYGYSMGGYAALKYAGLLGARAALSVCPQVSIDPADVGDFEKRYREFFDPRLNQHMMIRPGELCPRNIVVFDPMREAEREHARRIARCGAVDAVIAPFGGHQAIRLITEGGIGGRLIDIAAGDQPAGAAVRLLLRTARAASYTYWQTRGAWLTRHHRSWLASRRQAYERAAALGPDKLDAAIGVLGVLLAEGQTRQATAWLDRMLPAIAKLRNPAQAVWLFRYSLRADHAPAARVAGLRAVTLRPDDPLLHTRFAHVLIDAGEPDEAARHIALAAGQPGADLARLARLTRRLPARLQAGAAGAPTAPTRDRVPAPA